MSTELLAAFEQLARERGIAAEVLFEAVEAALISAYKRNFGTAQNVRVSMDRETGEIHVYARKDVVETVSDSKQEISLDDAKAVDIAYQLGDVVEQEVTPKDFGRIAAQTAKQVVVQRIREAERSLVYDEFANRENDIVTGVVQRIEQRQVYVDLGKAEAVLPPTEQINGEPYRYGERIKTFIDDVHEAVSHHRFDAQLGVAQGQFADHRHHHFAPEQ